MSLDFILATLLIDLCLFVEKSNALFDGGTPGDMLLSFLPPGLWGVTHPKVLDTMSFHGHFWSPAACTLATNRITRGAAWVDVFHAGILTRWPRKWRRRWVKMDETLCFLALLQMVVWRFFQTEIPKMIPRQRIKKDPSQRMWGSTRTVLSINHTARLASEPDQDCNQDLYSQQCHPANLAVRSRERTRAHTHTHTHTYI